MGHRATVYNKVAALSSEFGLSLFRRKFGDRLADALLVELGTYSRGPRKGLARGYLHWKKCERGGWVATGPAYAPGERTQGHVQTPGSYGYVLRLDRDDFSAVVAHHPDEIAGPNDETKEAAIVAGARQVLAAKKGRRS